MYFFNMLLSYDGCKKRLSKHKIYLLLGTEDQEKKVCNMHMSKALFLLNLVASIVFHLIAYYIRVYSQNIVIQSN